MKKFPAFLLLFLSFLALACGHSGNNRQLQSITITETTSGADTQFVATGTFSAPPITVTPLPVFWSLAPPPAQYTLTTQPFLYHCFDLAPGPIIAWAPANPNAPSSGSISKTKMVTASTGCPQT